ncbi:MAG: hypothetical protein F4X77_17900 [Acidobacteriia bacterium]|nr:hypothetical protein [Terriglobia bacterium]
MKRSERIGGRAVPVRLAKTATEVGLLLEPGVIVEMDPDTAAACGACEDDCIDWEEAFEAAEDPFEFGDEGSGDEAA